MLRWYSGWECPAGGWPLSCGLGRAWSRPSSLLSWQHPSCQCCHCHTSPTLTQIPHSRNSSGSSWSGEGHSSLAVSVGPSPAMGSAWERPGVPLHPQSAPALSELGRRASFCSTLDPPPFYGPAPLPLPLPTPSLLCLSHNPGLVSVSHSHLLCPSHYPMSLLWITREAVTSPRYLTHGRVAGQTKVPATALSSPVHMHTRANPTCEPCVYTGGHSGAARGSALSQGGCRPGKHPVLA